MSDPFSVFDEVFRGRSQQGAVDKLRDAMKRQASQRDSIEAGFAHGVRAAAKLVRESGNDELATRIENLKLVRKQA